MALSRTSFVLLFSRNVQVYHIRNERQVLGTVDSEWVVKLLYSFQDDRYVYLAMVCQ
jgi:protein-serine/threonine kinase/serine/threonine kinase 38